MAGRTGECGRRNRAKEATVKYRTHDEVRGEFITTQQDEADLAAFKEEALAGVRAHRLAEFGSSTD
jgi:hypothetical protein